MLVRMVRSTLVVLLAGIAIAAADVTQAQVRLEAEDMQLTTFRTESLASASNSAIINLKGFGFVGSATTTFPGTDGDYEIAVVYHDEQDGNAQLSLSIGAIVVDTWTLDQSPGGTQARNSNRLTRQVGVVTVSSGDAITIDALQGTWDHANVDYIEFTPANNAPAIRETFVATKGGDYDSPEDAIDDMSNWCRPPFDDDEVEPSAQCVIRIGAGIFPLQRTLRLEPGVSVIGAGAGVTVLAYGGDFAAVSLIGSRDFGSSISLRDLTIQHSASGDATAVLGSEPVDLDASSVEIIIRGEATVWGIRAFDSSVLKLDDVFVSASGSNEAVGILIQGSAECASCRISAEASTGIARGTQVWGWRDDEPSGLAVSESRISASRGTTMIGIDTERLVEEISIKDTHVRAGDRGDGTGLVLWRGFGSEGKFFVQGSTIDGGQGTGTDYGIQVLGGGQLVLEVDRSTLRGSASSVMLESGGTDYTIGIGGSKLDGPVSVPDGAPPAVTCAGVYDQDYTFYPDSCPE